MSEFKEYYQKRITQLKKDRDEIRQKLIGASPEEYQPLNRILQMKIRDIENYLNRVAEM